MTTRRTVLVADDELSFREALRVALESEGFDVVLASDGAEAIDVFDATDPDLVLLDVMMPKVSGLDVCRRLRRTSDVPIIMVSAKSEEIDTVVGLEVGADDYVSKPYRLRELIARMRTVMRRHEVASSSDDPEAGTSGYSVGGVCLDEDRHEVTVDGRVVDLPLREFAVLSLMLENAGLVVTRSMFMDRVWGYDYVGDTKTLDVHIKRLRAKIEADPRDPRRILTVRGVGYKFSSD